MTRLDQSALVLTGAGVAAAAIGALILWGAGGALLVLGAFLVVVGVLTGMG